jgi:hypothetical protein
LVVLKLDRRTCLPVVRSLLIRRRNLVLGRVRGRYSGIVHGRVVCCSIMASLCLLLRAVVANSRVDQEAEEGKATAGQD